MYIKSTIKTIKNKDLTVIIGSEEGEELNLNMAGENPVTIDMDGNLDDIYHPASLTSANLRFVFNDEDKVTENNDKETLRTVIEWLSGISFNEVPVAVLLDNQLIFSGFVNPNIREGNYYDPVTELEIVAYDLLSALQYITFDENITLEETSILNIESCFRRCNKVLTSRMGSLKRFVPIFGKVDSANFNDDLTSIVNNTFSRYVFQKDNEGDGHNGFASFLDIFSEIAKLLGLTITQIPSNVLSNINKPCIVFTDYNDDYNSDWTFTGFEFDGDDIIELPLFSENANGKITDLYLQSRGTGDTISNVNNYNEAIIKTNQEALVDKDGNKIDLDNLALIDFKFLQNIKSDSEGAPTRIYNEVLYCDPDITWDNGKVVPALPTCNPDWVQTMEVIPYPNIQYYTGYKKIIYGTQSHNRNYYLASIPVREVSDSKGNKLNCIRFDSFACTEGRQNKNHINDELDKYTNKKVYINESNKEELENIHDDWKNRVRGEKSTIYGYIGNIDIKDSNISIEINNNGKLVSETVFTGYNTDTGKGGVILKTIEGDYSTAAVDDNSLNRIFNNIVYKENVTKNLKFINPITKEPLDLNLKGVECKREYNGSTGAGFMRWGTSDVSPDDPTCNPSFKDYLVISNGLSNISDLDQTPNPKEPTPCWLPDMNSDTIITEVDYTSKPSKELLACYKTPNVTIYNKSFSDNIQVKTKKHNAIILGMDVNYPNMRDIFNLPFENFSSFNPSKAEDNTGKTGIYKQVLNQLVNPYAFFVTIKLGEYYFGTIPDDAADSWLFGKTYEQAMEGKTGQWFYSRTRQLLTPIRLEHQREENGQWRWFFCNPSGRKLTIKNENNEFSGYFSQEKGLIVKYAESVDYDEFVKNGKKAEGLLTFSDQINEVTLNKDFFSIGFCKPLPTMVPSANFDSWGAWDDGWRRYANQSSPSKLYISNFKATLTGNQVDEDSEEYSSKSAKELKLVRNPNKLEKSNQNFEDTMLLNNSTDELSLNNNITVAQTTKNYWKHIFVKDYSNLYTSGKRKMFVFDGFSTNLSFTELNEFVSNKVNGGIGDVYCWGFKLEGNTYYVMVDYYRLEPAIDLLYKLFTDRDRFNAEEISVYNVKTITYSSDYINKVLADIGLDYSRRLILGSDIKYNRLLIKPNSIDSFRNNTYTDNKFIIVDSEGNLEGISQVSTDGVIVTRNNETFDKVSSDKLLMWKIYNTYMRGNGLLSVSKNIDFDLDYQLHQYDWKKIVPEGIRSRGGGYWHEWDEVIEHVIHRAGDRYLDVTGVKSDIKPEDTIELGRYIQTDDTIEAFVQTYPNKATSPSTSLLLTNPPKVGDYYFVTNNVEYGVDFVTREPYQDASGVWRFDTTDYTGTRLDYYDEPSNYGKHTFRKYVSENGTQSIWYPNSGSTVANFGIFTKFEEREGELYAYSVDLRRGTYGDFNPMGFTYTRGQYEEDEIEYETIHHKEWIPYPTGLGTILRIITSKVDLANESIECELAMITNCYEQNMDLTSEYHHYKAYYVPSNKDYNLDGSINFGGSVTDYIRKAIDEDKKDFILDSNKALCTDGQGEIVTSVTSSRELSYLAGARENIQAQIDRLGGKCYYTSLDEIDLSTETDENDAYPQYTLNDVIEAMPVNSILNISKPDTVDGDFSSYNCLLDYFRDNQSYTTPAGTIVYPNSWTIFKGGDDEVTGYSVTSGRLYNRVQNLTYDATNSNYYWSVIGGSNYTAGDGIDISDDNEISLKRRVFFSLDEVGKAIGTTITTIPTVQELYNMMPEGSEYIGKFVDISNPPQTLGILSYDVNAGTIVIYKPKSNNGISLGRIFAYNAYIKDSFAYKDLGKVTNNGDFYIPFTKTGTPTDKWLSMNDYIVAGDGDGAAGAFVAGIRISTEYKTSATAKAYYPLVGWPSSKKLGAPYGDSNVSIGTFPNDDTSATDTKLFINWETGTETGSRGTNTGKHYFQKDGTTSFKSRGFTPNSLIVSDANGVETSSSGYTTGGTGKISHIRLANIVIVNLNGATPTEIRNYHTGITAATVPTNYFEGVILDISSGTPKEIYIKCGEDRISMSQYVDGHSHVGQLIYFAAS